MAEKFREPRSHGRMLHEALRVPVTVSLHDMWTAGQITRIPQGKGKRGGMQALEMSWSIHQRHK